jgi:hypothetical protein
MNVARQGLRVIYDPEAIAEEPPTPNDGIEFRRKIRVVAYGIQSLVAGDGLPGRFQWKLLWVYGSHKLLRWLAPFFLLAALAASFAGAFESPFLLWIGILQAAFYGLALAGWKLPALRTRFCRVPYYFSMVNLAALRGVIRGLRKGQRPVWARTERHSAETLPQSGQPL